MEARFLDMTARERRHTPTQLWRILQFTAFELPTHWHKDFVSQACQFAQDILPLPAGQLKQTIPLPLVLLSDDRVIRNSVIGWHSVLFAGSKYLIFLLGGRLKGVTLTHPYFRMLTH
jgi:hypothetical protein